MLYFKTCKLYLFILSIDWSSIITTKTDMEVSMSISLLTMFKLLLAEHPLEIAACFRTHCLCSRTSIFVPRFWNLLLRNLIFPLQVKLSSLSWIPLAGWPGCYSSTVQHCWGLLWCFCNWKRSPWNYLWTEGIFFPVQGFQLSAKFGLNNAFKRMYKIVASFFPYTHHHEMYCNLHV